MFDTSKSDAQATLINELEPKEFDFDEYSEYASKQDKKVRIFLQSDSGVLVYRRFRVAEVYSYECRNREKSLRYQLGALKASMSYEADMANYLEPWYGIGIGASAFGAEYSWKEGLAPAVVSDFDSVEDVLEYDAKPIAETEIGKEQLAYIEYFLDATKGKLPMSFGDVQSPLNIISEIVPVTNLFVDMMDDEDMYLELAQRTAVLMKEYLRKQKDLIGSLHVLPGHGFASSREISGMGVSADTSIMINNDMFDTLEAPIIAELCEPFGGAWYHSCGNWDSKVDSVLRIPGLIGGDAAFGTQTDPSPNTPEVFGQAFAGTSKVLNIRVVGDPDEVTGIVKRIWTPGLKLIVDTYCDTPEQQKEVYRRIHEICI